MRSISRWDRSLLCSTWRLIQSWATALKEPVSACASNFCGFSQYSRAFARASLTGMRGYLRGNKLSNTIYENYDDILEKACQAWMFFANDKERVTSITTRQWAKVNL